MSGRFEMTETPIPGLRRVKRLPSSDQRGWLERIYDVEDLADLFEGRHVAQINRSLTLRAGTVRGMHYQVRPSAEAKLVGCLRGSVFDVAVDVRRGSPTFLGWHGELLTAENRVSLFMPEGFAHGFQAMSEETELVYVHTAGYDRTAERGIHPLDPRVSIKWPLTVMHLSERDASHPVLDAAFQGFD